MSRGQLWMRFVASAELLDWIVPLCDPPRPAASWRSWADEAERLRDYARRNGHDFNVHGEQMLSSRDYLLVADALEARDHRALAGHVRQLAARVYAEALAVADELEHEEAP